MSGNQIQISPNIYSRTRGSAVFLVRPPRFYRLCKQNPDKFVQISSW